MKRFVLAVVASFVCLGAEAATLETEIFGSPDFRPPSSWSSRKVCGREFWTILKYPRTEIYDEYAPFVAGEEPQRFAIFRESGDWVCSLKTYVERRAKDNPVPFYVTGTRYNSGLHFLPPERWGLTEAAVRLRKNGESTLPETAIDGNVQTGWAFPPFLPQWLLCKLPSKTAIDRVRLLVDWDSRTTCRFSIDVSEDGHKWTTVADERQNTQPMVPGKGRDFRFGSQEVMFIRLTITSGFAFVREIEAYRQAVKVSFTGAEASDSVYADIFRSANDTQRLASQAGDAFLGSSTEEWGNDIGHLHQFWAGDKNVFAPARNALEISGGKASDLARYVPKQPKSAPQYLAFLESEYRRLTAIAGGQCFDLESVCLYLPYVAEWGSPLLAEEFHLAGTNSYSLGWDMLRGVARQYGRPAMAYLTNYNGAYAGGVRTRTVTKLPIPKGYTKPWEDCNPHNGVSLPFEKRWLWFNYLSGANLVDFREDNYFYDRDVNNVQRLSPLGKVVVNWYEEVKRHPDRGIRATPIAIAFDYSRLLPRDMKSANGGPDVDEIKSVDSLMWGGSFYDGTLRGEQIDFRYLAVDKVRQSHFRPEHGALRNRSLGEVFDWIMLNAPSGTGEAALKNYRAVFLVGKFQRTQALTAGLQSFLGHGGIVVANAAQVSVIPEEFRAITIDGYIDDSEDIHDELTGRDYVMSPYQGPVSKDNLKSAYRLALTQSRQPVRKIFRDKANRPAVLWSKAAQGGIFWVLGETYGHNFLPILNDLLKQIADHRLPVKVTGDIQWLANKTDTGWVIGLFNNAGVYPKDPYQEADVDPCDQKEVAIECLTPVANAREWLSGVKLPVSREDNSNLLRMTVPAADVRIVQFDTAQSK